MINTLSEHIINEILVRNDFDEIDDDMGFITTVLMQNMEPDNPMYNYLLGVLRLLD